MNTLLTVIAFNAETAPLAERLCDFIFDLGGRTPSGHALLVAASDTHKEMCVKVAIAAEVAFETSELVMAPEISSPSPAEVANQLFRFSGEFVVRHFRCPWLWLEPACVPVKKNWREHLLMAYNSQPRRYLGGHLQFAPATADEPAKVCLARCSIYPPDAIGEMHPFCSGSTSFQFNAARTIVARSTKTRLIQELGYDGDNSKIRPDACIVSGDKSGKLIEHIQSTLPQEPMINIPITNGDVKPKLSVDERMAKARAARGKIGTTEMARL